MHHTINNRQTPEIKSNSNPNGVSTFQHRNII